MRQYNTVNDIKTEVEVLNRNVTGRKQLTATEADIVYGSIIDSYQLCLMEYGVANFKFAEYDVTATTVSGQNYVDLDEYVYRVVPGTVRITSEGIVLSLIDEPAIYGIDPDADDTGPPESYAYANKEGSPNYIRLFLWPIPDSAYTINLKVLKMPTDTPTNFPTFLTGAIKHKAKALSCLGLGIPQFMPMFNRVYEDFIEKVKDGYEGDGARHIQRHFSIPITRGIQGRLPT